MIKAKKSLGQHFLASRGAVVAIVSAALLKEGENVIEIGPGRGILTEALLQKGARILAVEKDAVLFKFLEEKFSKEIESEQLKLINGDVLNFNVSDYGPWTTNYKLVANIPYYITGEILRKFIGGETKPSLAVFLVQKEVAERIMARGGKESVLSVSVKIYGEPEYVRKVPAGSFNPPPKVDSAVIAVRNIKNPFSGSPEEKKFFKVLKTGFSHKRKKLSGNLSAVFGKEKTAEAMVACGISENARAEDLKLNDWLCLSKNYLL